MLNSRWNYLFIPQLQRRNHWGLGMDKLYHPAPYDGCNYLSMLRLKLNHINERGLGTFDTLQTINYVHCSRVVYILLQYSSHGELLCLKFFVLYCYCWIEYSKYVWCSWTFCWNISHSTSPAFRYDGGVMSQYNNNNHDDVIKWKHFPRNWPFVREIHRSPVNFPHKGQWRGALMFSLIYAWINDWVNNRETGDLRRQDGHYDVIVMVCFVLNVTFYQ